VPLRLAFGPGFCPQPLKIMCSVGLPVLAGAVVLPRDQQGPPLVAELDVAGPLLVEEAANCAE